MKFSIISRNDLIILTAFMIAQGSARFQCTFDCCYVNFLRQQFAKPVTDLSRTGCCKIEGVSCDGESVTKINWSGKQLTGEIPSYIWKLAKLSSLDLSKNKITGNIPRPDEPVLNLRSLVLSNNLLDGEIFFDYQYAYFGNLNQLDLSNNPNLYGVIREGSQFLKESSLGIFLNTKIVVTGSSSTMAIPGAYFPSPKTEEDLKELSTIAAIGGEPDSLSASFNQLTATQSGLRISKRLLAISFVTISYGTYTCSNSDSLSPYQDCINSIAVFCQTGSPLFSSWSDCHDKVKAIRDVLGVNWKNYINSCARFFGGNPASSACTTATNTILTNEVYYYYSNGVLRSAYVTKALTDAAAYIWYT